MNCGYGIVMRLEQHGYVDVGHIPSIELKSEIESKTNAIAEEKLVHSVKARIGNYTGELFFTDQNPNKDKFGVPLIASHIFLLKKWAITEKRTIYFFNAPA